MARTATLQNDKLAFELGGIIQVQAIATANTLTLSGGSPGNVLVSGVDTPFLSNDATNKAYVDDLVNKFTDVGVATYSVLQSDETIGVSRSTSGPCTLTLPLIGTVGLKRYNIVDTGGSANTNAIKIQTSGSDTINGQPDVIINNNYNSISLTSDNNSSWFII